MYTIDPESLTWSPFDDYKEKLDRRRYVSLSRDRALEATRQAGGDVESQSSAKENETSNADPLVDEQELSLFDIHMPGVLTLQQVEEQVDLDHWKLLAHGVLVEMTVSSPLSVLSSGLCIYIIFFLEPNETKLI